MKTIPLTQNMVAFVDDEDYDFLMTFKWYACKERTNYYARTTKNSKKIKMHQMLILCENGKEIDHIDNNGLNNQKINLRVCLRRENGTNTRIRKDNSSGFKGVSFSSQRNKFESKIAKNGKTIHLGRFDTAKEAALAYNEAAIGLFGVYAKINVLE